MPKSALASRSTAVLTPGWLVIDPTGAAYAWYSQAIATDITAVWKLIGRNAAIRKRYVADGWTVRAGSWPELFSDGAELVAVSA
ncbi:hypothetical protein [Mycobacterium servetii]|uniref:Uncharacterized protein n=1 Tax=Mycobacterium servetii TaxID=3237418 RepID=A0ABV4C9M8_9MYCO